MPYIFLDESGDLGFDFSKKKTSRFFIIACIISKDKKPLEKVVKKVISRLSKKRIKVFKGILHFYKESPSVKRKFLKILNKENFEVYAIYIDKRKIFSPLKNKKHFLYNQATKIILEKINDANLDFVEVFVSRKETSGFLNKQFCKNLQEHFLKNHKKNINISICLPHKEKCLQVADSVSWTIYSKVEFNNDEYFKIIQDKVKIKKIKEKHFL